MGYVPKAKVKINENGKLETWIGDFRIVKESEHMTAIYLFPCGLLTSKPKWSQAIKLAKLLKRAYDEGVDEGRCL
ncbi:hypothetical protein [Bacillus phage vB_BanS-Thrax1]|nr:hypothetical protein [Bacillus phage vB_BanS-Thrax1]